MKIGQNWPFAFWPKSLNFEYSRKKRYFSANRRWFLLGQIRPFSVKSDKYFLFFKASEVQLSKIDPNWPFAFWPKSLNFEY